MSGIARVLIAQGHEVTGSDLKESRNTARLRELGATVFVGHSKDNLGKPEAVVVSSAIPDSNPELLAARKRLIPVLPRAAMLAQLVEGKTSIAVAGTHGKTTTTSLIAHVLERCGLDPTFLIGGELNDIGSNAKCGQGEYLIAEADESDGSLLLLKPTIAVITNIEADHLDHFADIDEIDQVFLRFLSQLPETGCAIMCGDHPGVQRLMARTGAKHMTYGFSSGNDVRGEVTELGGTGSSFNAFAGEDLLGAFHLTIPGAHNVLNALAAVALARMLELDLEQVSAALSSFAGVQRRFQELGRTDGITVVDDYAHHPSEVMATLAAAGTGDWRRVLCVFQPHRYSRTKSLGADFGLAFDDTDVVVITDVYSAGEEPVPGVTGKLLVEAVLKNNPRKNVVYLPKKNQIADWLYLNSKPGDLVLTMGAGDIWSAGEELLRLLESPERECGKA